MITKRILTVAISDVSSQYDSKLFENITWSQSPFHNHNEIAISLKNKHPFTITILIDPLKWDLIKNANLVTWNPWYKPKTLTIRSANAAIKPEF